MKKNALALILVMGVSFGCISLYAAEPVAQHKTEEELLKERMERLEKQMLTAQKVEKLATVNSGKAIPRVPKKVPTVPQTGSAGAIKASNYPKTRS